METLKSRRSEVGGAANEALQGELTSTNLSSVRELLEVSERVLRRRRAAQNLTRDALEPRVLKRDRI